MKRMTFLFSAFLFCLPVAGVANDVICTRDEDCPPERCERDTCYFPCVEEVCDYIHPGYCYSLKYGEGIAEGVIGNSHGPTLILLHGGRLTVQPFYDADDLTPEERRKDFIDDKNTSGCATTTVMRPYDGIKSFCPAKNETTWLFPFPKETPHSVTYHTYAWLENDNERDRPVAEAIVNSLVILSQTECDAAHAAYRKSMDAEKE